MSAIISYQDLDVWKRSMRLVTDVYRLTKMFPNDERYGLSSQMQRSAVSIPSNIAEGYHRNSRKEYRRFIHYSFASCAELETQILIVGQLEFADKKFLQEITEQVQVIMKMLNVFGETFGRIDPPYFPNFAPPYCLYPAR